MSELLTAAAERLGAPEDLVMRSAQARAAAEGMTVEDVLSAWSGGAAAAPADAAVAAPIPESPAIEPATAGGPAVAAEGEAPPPVAAPAAAAPAPAQPAAVVAPPPIIVEVIEEPEEPVEIPPLGSRVRPPAALGAVSGLVLAFFGLLLASPWLIGAASASTGQDASPALVVDPVAVVAAAAAISVIFGGLTAVLCRSLPTYAHPGARLSIGSLGAFVTGCVAGLLAGAVTAGALLALGETMDVTSGETVETRALLPLLPTLGVVLAGGALLGLVAAMAPHLIGMPAALRGEAAEEPALIRRRLALAYSGPVLIISSVLVLIYSFSRVLLRWPEYAPAAAAIVAFAVLGFAALLRLRPGTRLRRGDVYAAVSGVAVILIVIVALLTTFAGGGGEPEPEDGSTESALVVSVT